MDGGYIKLSRKFFSNELWNEARTFSSCEAWLDLIQSARFEATPRKVSIGGREVSYQRGQYPASIRFLSQRWQWTERRIRTFLSYLKKEGMIEVSNDQGVNIITLCKYDEYNTSDTADDTANDTSMQKEINDLREQVTQLLTQQMTHPMEERHTGDTNTKKGKKEEKENTPNGVSKKDAAKAATLKRKQDFGESLIPFVAKYGKEMIWAFFDYWSEMNKTCTKMRFEQQPTWEVAKRLATWANKDKTYENNRSTGASKQEANEYALQLLNDCIQQREQGLFDEIPKPF